MPRCRILSLLALALLSGCAAAPPEPPPAQSEPTLANPRPLPTAAAGDAAPPAPVAATSSPVGPDTGSASPTPPSGWRSERWRQLLIPLSPGARLVEAAVPAEAVAGLPVLAAAHLEYPDSASPVERPYGPDFILVAFAGTLDDWLDAVRSSAGLTSNPLDERTVRRAVVAGRPAVAFQRSVTGTGDSQEVGVDLPGDQLLIIMTRDAPPATSAAIIAGLALTADTVAPDELAQVFGATTGCFALRDLAGGHAVRSDDQECQKRLSPCSTFKVPHALIALETGVASDEHHTLAWDGQPHRNPAWNRDHTLASAVRESVVWYFQRVAAAIGEERMQRALTALDYGNADISGGQTRFWIQSSLAISADEQVAFLERLYAGGLPFSQRSQSIIRRLIVLEERDGVTLSGKTGSCISEGRRTLGWFVGAVTGAQGTSVFATVIEASDGADGQRAKALSEAILRQLKLLP